MRLMHCFQHKFDAQASQASLAVAARSIQLLRKLIVTRKIAAWH